MSNTQTARALLNRGVEFGYRNPEKAAECFREAKLFASDDPSDQTKNTARMYLACIYNSLHVPGVRQSEAAGNNTWLDLAVSEFTEFLNHNPSDYYAKHAVRAIEAIRLLRTR